jgi:hypothetical protein
MMMLGMQVAEAAPPSNDNFANATTATELSVSTSEPLFAIDDFTLSGGKVTPKTGLAVISGTITCSNGPAFVELDVFVSQQIGPRATVTGSGFDGVECSGTDSWSVTVEPSLGRFVGGPAFVSAAAFGPNGEFIVTQATIRLRHR